MRIQTKRPLNELQMVVVCVLKVIAQRDAVVES
jgi:hypothetical protein